MARYARFAAFDRLSEKGKLIVLRGIEADWTQQRIQDELAQATGESISNGALGRYVQYVRRQSEQMDRLDKTADKVIKAAKQDGEEAEERAAGLIALAMLSIEDDVTEMTPVQTLRLQRDYLKLRNERTKLELDKEKAQIDKERVAIEKRKVALSEQRILAVAAEAERAGVPVTRDAESNRISAAEG